MRWCARMFDSRCHRMTGIGVLLGMGLEGLLLDTPVPPSVEGAASVEEEESDLFARLYPTLWRFASVVGGPGNDPDDLVQEAVMRSLRLGPLTELDEPGAYLRRSITNLASNERRRRFRHDRALRRSQSDDSVTHDEHPSDLAVLSRLKPSDRAVLWLVDVEGWAFVAAAEALGCTETAARSRAVRARAALKTHLEEVERYG